MRATRYAARPNPPMMRAGTGAVRRNPDDTVEIVAVLALVGVGVWAVYEQFKGFGAAAGGVANALGVTGSGVGSALGATGGAVGGTFSAVGTGANNAEQGIGGIFSGLGSDIHGLTGW